METEGKQGPESWRVLSRHNQGPGTSQETTKPRPGQMTLSGLPAPFLAPQGSEVSGSWQDSLKACLGSLEVGRHASA